MGNRRPLTAIAPGVLPLIELGDRITQMISETDSDPDYERAKQIFAELLAEMEQETNG